MRGYQVFVRNNIAVRKFRTASEFNNMSRRIKTTLPATKTIGPRTVEYVPSADAKTIEDGIVTVSETVGVRNPRCVQTRYLIEEQAPSRGCRCWLILKDHTTAAGTVAGEAAADRCGNVYEVYVNERGEGHCTCTGWQASAGRNECVHRLAMRALVKAGFPSALDNGDADFHDYRESCDISPEVMDYYWESRMDDYPVSVR